MHRSSTISCHPGLYDEWPHANQGVRLYITVKNTVPRYATPIILVRCKIGDKSEMYIGLESFSKAPKYQQGVAYDWWTMTKGCKLSETTHIALRFLNFIDINHCYSNHHENDFIQRCLHHVWKQIPWDDQATIYAQMIKHLKGKDANYMKQTDYLVYLDLLENDKTNLLIGRCTCNNLIENLLMYCCQNHKHKSFEKLIRLKKFDNNFLERCAWHSFGHTNLHALNIIDTLIDIPSKKYMYEVIKKREVGYTLLPEFHGQIVNTEFHRAKVNYDIDQIERIFKRQTYSMVMALEHILAHLFCTTEKSGLIGIVRMRQVSSVIKKTIDGIIERSQIFRHSFIQRPVQLRAFSRKFECINILHEIFYRRQSHESEPVLELEKGVKNSRKLIDQLGRIFQEPSQKDLINALQFDNPDFDICEYSHFGRTALHNACLGNGTISQVAMLINRGAQIDQTTANSGSTALQIAVSSGKIDLVQYLIEMGANVDHVGFDSRPLFFEVVTSELKPEIELPMLRLLLRKSANILACDQDGNTLLHLAAIYDKDQIIEELITNWNFHVLLRNKNGRTIISSVKDLEMLKTILYSIKSQDLIDQRVPIYAEITDSPLYQTHSSEVVRVWFVRFLMANGW